MYQITDNEIEEIDNWYDIIVVGGGTAGLSAAIVAAKSKLRVLMLEKGKQTGPLPRGESMAYFSLEDDILGKGFVESIMTVGPSFRRYHSPNNKKSVLVDVHTPYRFFPWRPFIERFETRALEAGVTIRTKCHVIHPIISPAGICIGVEFRNSENNLEKAYALTTFGADGHDSIIGQAFGVDYTSINCPIIKFLGDNANVDIIKTPNPQFFMLSPGQLEIAPDFPPAAAYYFPIGGRKIEAGLMLRMGQVNKLKKISRPSKEKIMEVWEYLKSNYPGFSEVFSDIEVEYEDLTQMPNARMVENFVVGQGGAILIGDSAGFVDANGSSGLYYGMKMASEWVKIILPEINKVKENKSHFNQMIAELWASGKGNDYSTQFKRSKVFKHIKTSYSLIGLSETIIFRWFKTAKIFNRFWWVFTFMIKSAS